MTKLNDKTKMKTHAKSKPQAAGLIRSNTLFTGDCLYILHGIDSESVDLIYLDPPFNSKRMYSAPVGSKAAGAAFKDTWTWQDVDQAYLENLVNDYSSLVRFIRSIGNIHSTQMMSYITYMTQRLVEMHRVLKQTGSLYLHCDPTASHYLKVVLDRIFGRNNFKNEVVWFKGYRGTPRKNRWQQEHDVIFFYAKDYDKCKWMSPVGEYKDKSLSRYNKIDDEGNRYALIKRRRANGDVYYGKTYPKGKPAGDVINVPLLAATDSERTGYPTQKPLALLRRVIEASSDEDDIVLDPFCGCATTCVAAQQLDRRWIGIDISEKSKDLVMERLKDDAGLFTDFIHRTDTPQRTDIETTPINLIVKESLYKEQRGLCNGCQAEMEMRHLEIDHVIPRSKGGGDYYDNYQLLCGHCNRTKGDKPMEYLLSKIAARESHILTF